MPPLAAFRFLQGTNAHAALEMLDLGQHASLFGRASPAWQHARSWLLPPASVLLQRCQAVRAGPGAPQALGHRVLLQGQLRRVSVAELVLSCGATGGWAVAAETAYAAAAALAAANSGKQRLALGIAHATLAPTAGKHLEGASMLSAAVDARSGSIVVSAGSAVLLQAFIAVGLEHIAVAHAPAQQQQPQPRQPGFLPAAPLLPAAVADAEVVAATLAAPPTAQAQQHSGLFLQPTLLHAAAQLLQLPASVGGGSEPQPVEPTSFGLLLPGIAPADRKRGKICCSGTWRASVAKHSLLLRSHTARCTLAVRGMRQQALPPSKRHGVAAACAAPPAVHASYAAVWQAVQPVAATDPSVLPAGASRPAAVLSYGSTYHARQISSSTRDGEGTHAPHIAVTLQPCTGHGSDVGQAACFHGMQLLQAAAAAGQGSLALSTTGPTAAPCPAPQSTGGSNAATCSAALHAMLRCVASELVGTQCIACSMDAASPSGLAAASRGSAAWNAAYGCHGQQLTGSTWLAARLLPATMLQQRQLQHARLDCAGQAWAVSGGTGALGKLAAGWMQWCQAAAVLLLGRSGRLASDALSALLHSGHGCLTVRMCDAAVQSDTAAAAAGQLLPLSGLVHAGGVLHDVALLQQSPASIHAVHAPKTAGLCCLLRAAAAAPLQQALLFSSVAAVTGPTGSTNYAAANGALDAAAGSLQLQGELGDCSLPVPVSCACARLV